jgi:hypothetical protein
MRSVRSWAVAPFAEGRSGADATAGALPTGKVDGEFRTLFEKSGQMFEAQRMCNREHPS